MAGFRPPIAKEIKEQILARVKSGVSVAQVARDAGVNAKTIYNWMERQSGVNPGRVPTANWQREKMELLEVIGSLTFKLAKWEKKYAHQ